MVDGQQALDRLRYGPGVFEEKWVRARLTFEDGGALRCTIPAASAPSSWCPTKSASAPTRSACRWPNSASALALRPGRHGAAAPLKARLMDQERLAGVGNLLADEILWRAGLAPGRRTPLGRRRAARPAHRPCVRPCASCRRRGGSHMGELMEQRHAEGRCPLDGTELRREQVGGRTTYWCPRAPALSPARVVRVRSHGAGPTGRTGRPGLSRSAEADPWRSGRHRRR